MWKYVTGTWSKKCYSVSHYMGCQANLNKFKKIRRITPNFQQKMAHKNIILEWNVPKHKAHIYGKKKKSNQRKHLKFNQFILIKQYILKYSNEKMHAHQMNDSH